MEYNCNSASPMLNTTINPVNTIQTTGSLAPYGVGTLATYGNNSEYYTGGENSIFDTAIKSQETNYTLTSRSISNNYDYAYQGNVKSATATAQTAEVQKLANDLCNLIANNQLDEFVEHWKTFKTAVAQNSIYSQAVDTSNSKEIAAMAEIVFQKFTGYDIREILNNTANSSAINGLMIGGSFGLAGTSMSVDDCLSYISGTKTKVSTKATEIACAAGGGAITSLAAVLGGSTLLKAADFVFNSADSSFTKGWTIKNTGKAALATAIVGTGLSAIISLFRVNENNVDT